jgi:lysozyme family protein
MVERLVDRLLTNQGRYESVANALGIPWYFVAVIQNMESSQDFSRRRRRKPDE